VSLPYGSDWLIGLLMLLLMFTGIGWARIARRTKLGDDFRITAMLTSASAWVATFILFLSL
jgi:hypothetical protein